MQPASAPIRRHTAEQGVPRALLGAAILATALVLLPIGITVKNAMTGGWALAAELIWRPLTGELLLNTLGLIVGTCLLCGATGTVLAWLMERTDLPGRRFWAPLAVAPLTIPAFITSFTWLSISPAFATYGGALLVVSTAYYPFVYLPVAAALRGMDPALEETARALGRNFWSMLWRVVLPQLRPALLGGMLLVALNTLVEFGAFALLRFRTFTTAIYGAYRTGFSGPEPALLAMVLLLLCILCLTAEALIRGKSRYGRLARGTRGAALRYGLGRWRWPAMALPLLLGLATTFMPLATICFWMTRPADSATTVAGASYLGLLRASWSSVSLGIEAACLTLALALPLGFLATRHQGLPSLLLERCAYLAQGIPGIVVALALISLSVHHLRPLYQSRGLLVIAYAILFLPLALVSVRAALSQAQTRLEEAAHSLGLGRVETFWRVTLPLAAPGFAAAACMVFISVVTELTTTLLMAPIGTWTLATELWADTSTVAFAAAAPYAAVMVAISMAASWLLAGRLGRAGVLSFDSHS
ncbi:ABC transporter permease [Acidocella sp.]|uniref:ABC transporter permease n=1 Tax=Acidocella sp. TaxID=50710 RepID=UPI003CFD8384